MFSDFEPEASDARIEEGWENITYFLPGKEKRRPAFYLLSCAGILCALLMIVAGAIILYNYKISATEIAEHKPGYTPAAKDGSILNENNRAQSKSKPDLIRTGKEKTRPANSKDINEIENTFKYQSQKTGSNINDGNTGSLNDHKEITPLDKNSKAGKNPGKENSKSYVASVSVTKEATGKTIIKNEEAVQQQAAENKNASITAGPENISLPLHSPLPQRPASDSIKELPLVNLPMPAANLRGVFKLHVFGGPAYAANALHDKTYDTHKNTRTIGASLGIALNYQFINKVSVIGQFVLSQNKLDHKQSLTQRADLINIQSIAGVPEKKYVEAYTVSEFKSKQSYNVAAGMGYRFYQRDKLGLNAFMLLNLRAVNYRYKETHTLGTQEITYLPGVNVVPPAAPADFPLPDVNESIMVKTTALVPGLIVDYKLTKQFAVIFRPSYFLQVPDNNGRYKNLFLVKQNTLYLDLGVQLKW